MSTRVSCFGPTDTTPRGTLRYQEAKALVMQGAASWINRCKGIRLTNWCKSIRGESANVQPRTMDKAVDGVPYAVEIIDAWKFNRPVKTLKTLKVQTHYTLAGEWHSFYDHPSDEGVIR